MKYYLKYIKYKNKYLSLKGGKIPEIEEHAEPKKKYLPLNYSNHKLILNKKVIKDGKMPIYNLNSNFEYEVNETDILPDIVKNYYLFFKDIININGIEIPFEILFLENSFNIIYKMRELLISDIILPIFKNIIKDEDIILINSINAVIKDNNCDEKIYINDKIDYIELKKQIKDNIYFLNENKLKLDRSLDDNHNEVLQLKSDIGKKIFRKMVLSNDIEKLKNEIKYEYKDDSYMKEVNIYKIKKKTIEKKEFDVEINSINCENQLKMDIDKKISDIINFKSIVNNDTYNENVENEVVKNFILFENIYEKYFNIDFENEICIGISVKPNILNKYIFINKFRELLEILYSESKSEDEIKILILNLYDGRDAFINICDMMELYENTINTSQPITDCRIDGYSININGKKNDNKFKFYIKNEIKLIMELKEFIKHCDIIDNIDGLNNFLKIKTSIIFFASFIGAHLKKITFPKLDNFLFPTNIDNIICNLLNIQTDKLNSRYTDLITEEINTNENNEINKTKIEKIKNKIQKIKNKIEKNKSKLLSRYTRDTLIKKKIDLLYEKLDLLYENESKYTNYNIFNVSNLPNIFKYGNAMFEGNQFPDCVENALLHFVRAIIWDPKSINYNYDFLPDTSIKELKEFVQLIRIGNENTQKIKNEFNKIIQNQDQFRDLYKKTINGINYEIKSNISNFKIFLNFLFGITDSINHKYLNTNIKEIKEDNSIIYIEYKNISYILGFNIYDGHSIVTKNITNPTMLTNYKYINLIYLLSSDYINYKVTKFNIYDNYLQYYIDKNTPFYLIFLLLNKDLYFLSVDDVNSELYLKNIIIKHIDFFKKIFIKIDKSQLKNLISDTELYKSFILGIHNMLQHLTDESELIETINLYLSYLKLFDLKSDIFHIKIDDVLLKKLDIDNNFNNKTLEVSIFDYLCLNYDFDKYNDNSKNKLIEILNELLDNYSGDRNDILNERKLFVIDYQKLIKYPVIIDIKKILLKNGIILV
jgi:hypothetical protein